MTASKTLFLFDLDGTLIDTAPTLAMAVNLTRQDEGLAPLPVDDLRPMASQGAPGLLRVGFNIDPHHETFMERRARFLAHYRAHITEGTRLFPEIDALLEGLKARSMKVGIVTNKSVALTTPLLDALALNDRFDVVLGFDSPNCAMKPSPLSIEEALRLTNTAPEATLYAGDDRRDIQAAHNAQVLAAAAKWGYALSYEDWNADCWAEHPLALLDWVDQLNTGTNRKTPQML